MHDERPARLADRRRDRLPVERREGPQIDHLRLDTLLTGQRLGGPPRPLDERAVGDDGHVPPFTYDARLREWDGVVGAGVGTLVVGLAVQMLMLEEQHRILRAQRRSQQSIGVERVGRHHDVQARDMGEHHLAALAVVDRAAAQVTPGGDADDDGAGEGSIGSPAQGRKLVADLHHRRPDVVEELDLDHRTEAARGHPDRAADDSGLGQRAVEDTTGAEATL